MRKSLTTLAALVLSISSMNLQGCCGSPDDPDNNLKVAVTGTPLDGSSPSRERMCGVKVIATDEAGETIALNEVQDQDGCAYQAEVEPYKGYTITAEVDGFNVATSTAESNPSCSVSTDPNALDDELVLERKLTNGPQEIPVDDQLQEIPVDDQLRHQATINPDLIQADPSSPVAAGNPQGLQRAPVKQARKFYGPASIKDVGDFPNQANVDSSVISPSAYQPVDLGNPHGLRSAPSKNAPRRFNNPVAMTEQLNRTDIDVPHQVSVDSSVISPSAYQPVDLGNPHGLLSAPSKDAPRRFNNPVALPEQLNRTDMDVPHQVSVDSSAVIPSAYQPVDLGNPHGLHSAPSKGSAHRFNNPVALRKQLNQTDIQVQHQVNVESIAAQPNAYQPVDIGNPRGFQNAPSHDSPDFTPPAMNPVVDYPQELAQLDPEEE